MLLSEETPNLPALVLIHSRTGLEFRLDAVTYCLCMSRCIVDGLSCTNLAARSFSLLGLMICFTSPNHTSQ